MSPQQLLRETQRAAGHEQLTNWHDTLIAEGKNLKTIQEVNTSLTSRKILINFVYRKSTMMKRRCSKQLSVTMQLKQMSNDITKGRI